MIQVLVERCPEGRVAALAVDGHAGFENESGGDIVCSAVSALVGYLGLTFSELLKGRASLSADDGLFRLTVEAEFLGDETVATLLEGWVLSVQQLEENYQGWVKLEQRFLT